jgi:hypothetical protein
MFHAYYVSVYTAPDTGEGDFASFHDALEWLSRFNRDGYYGCIARFCKACGSFALDEILFEFQNF